VTQGDVVQIVEEVARGLGVPKPRIVVRKPQRVSECGGHPAILAVGGRALRIVPLALEELTPEEFRFGVAESLAGRFSLMVGLAFATMGLGVLAGTGGFWLMVAKLATHPLLGCIFGLFVALAAFVVALMLSFSVFARWETDRRIARALALTKDLGAARSYTFKRYENDWSGDVLKHSRVRAWHWLHERDRIAEQAGIG